MNYEFSMNKLIKQIQFVLKCNLISQKCRVFIIFPISIYSLANSKLYSN